MQLPTAIRISRQPFAISFDGVHKRRLTGIVDVAMQRIGIDDTPSVVPRDSAIDNLLVRFEEEGPKIGEDLSDLCGLSIEEPWRNHKKRGTGLR